METVTLRRGRAPRGTYAETAVYVRNLRRELGLSQSRLAGLLARSIETVREWEAGRARVPPTIAPRLVELLTWKRTGIRPWWADPFAPRE